jgi:hypothetical protein
MMEDFDLVNEHPEKTRLHGTDICTTNMFSPPIKLTAMI